jgi:hypothetical protein
MKIKVHYDFTQQELAGETDVIELPEGSKLEELLRQIVSELDSKSCPQSSNAIHNKFKSPIKKLISSNISNTFFFHPSSKNHPIFQKKHQIRD